MSNKTGYTINPLVRVFLRGFSVAELLALVIVLALVVECPREDDDEVEDERETIPWLRLRRVKNLE